jgi:molecular chaperone GrpE
VEKDNAPANSHGASSAGVTPGGEKKEPFVQIPREEYEKILAQAQELLRLKDQLLRSAADFDNAKKRLTRERDDFVKYAKESLIQSLLPILDNMERALAHAGKLPSSGIPPEIQSVLSGVQMVYKHLLEVLKGQGLKRIHAVGQVFDPHHHEAVAFVEEAGRADEVLEEVEPGYFLNDRLLRAAKVRIRMAPSGSGEKPPRSEGDKGPPPDRGGEKEDEIT